MTSGFATDSGDDFHPHIPMARIGEASEFSSAMVFLASDDASFITGVNLPVDGGATASDGRPRQLSEAF